MTWTILAMGLVTFLPRLWGLFLPTTRLRGFWQRFLDSVPVAVFAALVVPALPGEGLTDTAWRVLAASLTVVVGLRTRSLAPGLLAGLALYLTVRALGWAG